MKEWHIKFSKKGFKQLSELDKPIQQLIRAWIRKHLTSTDDPRLFGKPLTGSLKGLWRYRIGDYRLVCEIHDYVLIIVIIGVGHRKDIYK